jgi:dynein heavy chain, axonemal
MMHTRSEHVLSGSENSCARAVKVLIDEAVFLQMEDEVQRLQQVYSVYETHAKNVDSFSIILWADLDIKKIVDVTEEVAKKLKKMKHVSDMPIYEVVARNIDGFLTSLPLMKDLKSDALRKRHWTRLMEVCTIKLCTAVDFVVACAGLIWPHLIMLILSACIPINIQVTGQEFDMEPKTFTLGSMFAMKLEKFVEEIQKITGAAEKELTIETELKKLIDVWRDQKFSIAKYMKGTEDRGYILRSVEEIISLLEDMGLNLQSMMASPFVRPFIDEVRKWEQKLSLIGECIEVWMQVQRKWMYLESIFMGSDDIRHQLPQVLLPQILLDHSFVDNALLSCLADTQPWQLLHWNYLPQEAKRFDGADRNFMKIMSDTAKNTTVVDACSVDGRLQTLQGLQETLETCQNSLSEYLDTKRCAFPRFYFISDVCPQFSRDYLAFVCVESNLLIILRLTEYECNLQQCASMCWYL